MIAISIVHAGDDTPIAHQIGSYLERNCSAAIDYEPVRNRELLDSVGRALRSDVMILLLSPDSVPSALSRGEWEPLFVAAREEYGTEIGFVQVADCRFPQVLLRSNVFSASDPLACARALKRWIFELRPPANVVFLAPPPAPTASDLAPIERAISDQPARHTTADLTIARAFAHESRPDFEATLWVDCREATLAEAAGEIGRQLGLSLPGSVASNTAAIRELCDHYRCLVVLIGPSPEIVAALDGTGRTSILMVHPAEPLDPVTIEGAMQVRRALGGWAVRPRDVPGSTAIRRCVHALLDAPDQWQAACECVDGALGYLRFHDRLAEAFELVETALGAAVAHRDADAAEHFGHERAWILESWGMDPGTIPLARKAVPPAAQLALF